jgi:Calcineurin-like phosphoesterase
VSDSHENQPAPDNAPPAGPGEAIHPSPSPTAEAGGEPVDGSAAGSAELAEPLGSAESTESAGSVKAADVAGSTEPSEASSPGAEPAEAPSSEGGAAVEGGAVEGSGAGTDGQPPEPEPSAPPGADAATGAEPADASGWVAPAPRADAPNAAPAANVLEVRELDWDAVRAAVANAPSGERAERIVARMEERLAGGGPLGLAFEEYAAGPADRAIRMGEEWPLGEVWFIGDVHGDLLALEAALQHIDRSGGGSGASLVFLGDLFDDGIHSAQVVLRVFELLLDGPARVTVIAGNHDEALAYGDGRFQSTVLPSDFTDRLNAHADDPLAARLGHLIIRFFERAPRALFFPDGLLVAHGGVPHTDLHEALAAEGNWNDPRMLQDFVWLRAHPRARKRIPNRTTRGSEFGRDDFTAFCEVATRLGRPVRRMVRGHDHVEERFAVYPAWTANPVLTINTLGHRLPREVFGPYERVPVVARWVRGELPEVRRLAIPPELIREVYPEPVDEAPAEVAS